MDRRKFLLTGIKVVPIGLGFTLLPNFASSIGLFLPNEDDAYTFNAWEKDFQNLVKQKELHGAIQTKLGNSGPFIAGHGKSKTDFELEKVVKNCHYLPDLARKFENAKAITPHVNLITNTNHDIKGQAFNLPNININTGVFLGISQKIGGSWNYSQLSNYVAYPAFFKYIGREAYFCYGTPCAPPQIFHCSQCDQEYAKQQFYYNGKSIYDNDKTYSKEFHTFYHNMKCSDPRNKEFGQHDGLNKSLKPIDPCKCDTDIIGVENELGG